MAALQPPTLNAPTPTLADWIELQTLCGPHNITNDVELIAIGQVEDDEESDNAMEADAKLEALADNVFAELERRSKAANGRYPFKLNGSGTAISLVTGQLNNGAYAYLFCLLISEYRRQQMIAKDIFTPLAKEVGDLFQVCSTVAAAGLLNGPAISFGFPRPDGSGFLDALRRCFVDSMREGQVETNARPGVSSHMKDGGIDIVAWRDFPDGLPGKLYLLGQCASGEQYPNKSVRGFLGSFHGDWFTVQPASPPIEALFIPFMLDHDLVTRRSESPNSARAGKYLSLTRDLGVIIDRCRIAFLVEDGIAIAQNKPVQVERAADFSRVKSWVDTITQSIKDAA